MYFDRSCFFLILLILSLSTTLFDDTKRRSCYSLDSLEFSLNCVYVNYTAQFSRRRFNYYYYCVCVCDLCN